LSRGVSAPVSKRNTEALTSHGMSHVTAKLTLKQGKPVPLLSTKLRQRETRVAAEQTNSLKNFSTNLPSSKLTFGGHTQNMVLMMVKFPTTQVVADNILARLTEKAY